MGLLLDSLRQAESNSSLESAPETSAKKISKLKDHLDKLHCAQVAEDIADFQERHSEIIHEPTISSRLTHLNPQRSRGIPISTLFCIADLTDV
jgi:CHAD domain-containing protein